MTWVGKSLRSMHGWLLLGSMFFVSGAQGAQTAGAAQGEGDSPVSAEEASVSSGPADMPARAPSLLQPRYGVDHTDVSLSLLVGAGPSYMGSRGYTKGRWERFSVFPGIFFLDDRGIGVQYGSDDGLMASLSIGADPGAQ